MNRIITIIAFSFLCIGCSREPDFSDPKSVITNYFELKVKRIFEKQYLLLSESSKELITLQEYKDYYLLQDSNGKSEIYISEIKQLPINPLYIKYRVFEIHYFIVKKNENIDSIKCIDYETVIKEDNKWKINWSKNLLDAAENLLNNQNYKDALKVYNNIRKWDPLNGKIYSQIALVQHYEDDNYFAKTNIERAIEINPQDDSNYNLLAGIYASEMNTELAIKNYKKAIELSLTNDKKITLYNNLALTYIDIAEFKDANKYLSLSFTLDSSSTHTWWIKGMIFEFEKNFDSAIFYYKRATSFKPMSNYLQNQLHYSLAKLVFQKACLIENNKNIQINLLDDSKIQILKAVELDPESSEYSELLNKINEKRNSLLSR